MVFAAARAFTFTASRILASCIAFVVTRKLWAFDLTFNEVNRSALTAARQVGIFRRESAAAGLNISLGFRRKASSGQPNLMEVLGSDIPVFLNLNRLAVACREALLSRHLRNLQYGDILT